MDDEGDDDSDSEKERDRDISHVADDAGNSCWKKQLGKGKLKLGSNYEVHSDSLVCRKQQLVGRDKW